MCAKIQVLSSSGFQRLTGLVTLMELTAPENRELGNAIDIAAVESHMLGLQQAECPVVHHFGPGIYIREVTLHAGTMAIGHTQKHPHLNIVLSGSVAMISADGTVKVVKAPAIFTGMSGRKVGYVIETCVWQNVYPNPDEERDIDKLEARWIDKSATWTEKRNQFVQSEFERRQPDRDDFDALIREAGFTARTVREQSENTADQVPMPVGWSTVITIRDSQIEGRGVFITNPVRQGATIGPARIGGFRTPLGRFTNHSKDPNAKFVKTAFNDIYLVATRDIAGCRGGDSGEEVTVDYRQALSLSGITFSEGDKL